MTIRLRRAERPRTLPLRKESARTGPLRLIDVDGLRSVGVRRHPRRAHRSDRHHRHQRAGRSSAAARASSSSVGARALGRFREWRDALARTTTRHLSVTPSRARGWRGEAADRRRRRCSAPCAVCRSNLPCTRRARWSTAADAVGDRRRGRGARRMGRGRPEGARGRRRQPPTPTLPWLSSAARMPARRGRRRGREAAIDAGARAKALIGSLAAKVAASATSRKAAGLSAPL